MTTSHKTQYSDAEIERLTRQLQAEGPDEFPEGYYRHVAEQQVAERLNPSEKTEPRSKACMECGHLGTHAGYCTQVGRSLREDAS